MLPPARALANLRRASVGSKRSTGRLWEARRRGAARGEDRVAALRIQTARAGARGARALATRHRAAAGSRVPSGGLWRAAVAADQGVGAPVRPDSPRPAARVGERVAAARAAAAETGLPTARACAGPGPGPSASRRRRRARPVSFRRLEAGGETRVTCSPRVFPLAGILLTYVRHWHYLFIYLFYL